jgi:hypothetical protein
LLGENSRAPGDAGPPAQERHQVAAFAVGGDLGAGEASERWGEVDVGDEASLDARLLAHHLVVAGDERHAYRLLVGDVLLDPVVLAPGVAVVRGVDGDRALQLARHLECIDHAGERLVYSEERLICSSRSSARLASSIFALRRMYRGLSETPASLMLGDCGPRKPREESTWRGGRVDRPQRWVRGILRDVRHLGREIEEGARSGSCG